MLDIQTLKFILEVLKIC